MDQIIIRYCPDPIDRERRKSRLGEGLRNSGISTTLWIGSYVLATIATPTCSNEGTGLVIIDRSTYLVHGAFGGKQNEDYSLENFAIFLLHLFANNEKQS